MGVFHQEEKPSPEEVEISAFCNQFFHSDPALRLRHLTLEAADELGLKVNHVHFGTHGHGGMKRAVCTIHIEGYGEMVVGVIPDKFTRNTKVDHGHPHRTISEIVELKPKHGHEDCIPFTMIDEDRRQRATDLLDDEFKDAKTDELKVMRDKVIPVVKPNP